MSETCDVAGVKIDIEVVQLIGSDGRPHLAASVPKVNRQFASGMHTVENATVRLGHWRGEFELVLGRRAPTARLLTQAYDPSSAAEQAEGEAIRAAVINALREGFVGGFVVNAEGATRGFLAIPDPVGATIDLRALRADYRSWFEALDLLETVPDHEDATIGELIDFAIDDLEAATYGELLMSVDELSTFKVHSSIMHGVVVGDDPRQSCAFLLAKVTGDNRWWRALR